ncbi:MAG: hypothetical protein COU08_00245 [Candidatus Harrisonbacteria bacterium CG10_big_fil_rev_8_21_14_0_10_42_17]|uniref:Uncharacterized protein n=1 Tax=Candidatus Harrisonbacteria bacterium CG10_big_fil_rev_8_21_14_0_10_42_17 TaxID=1974584 RepID=A0A2M6WJB1_9BACT|nr:MAG: hypothetical protein COU08_00245 [Candidatus Harrisonbacteria bacterium CG10_big_fil_rev_8_21_14_0_10_42_17]
MSKNKRTEKQPAKNIVEYAGDMRHRQIDEMLQEGMDAADERQMVDRDDVVDRTNRNTEGALGSDAK